MTTIKISNAKFYAYHGVLEYEKDYGNEFQIDVEMKCDLSSLEDSDDLKKTVNYHSAYKIIEKIFNEKKYNLIETLNQNICKGILENFPMVDSVRVSIRKPNAPLGIIDYVEVTNEVTR